MCVCVSACLLFYTISHITISAIICYFTFHSLFLSVFAVELSRCVYVHVSFYFIGWLLSFLLCLTRTGSLSIFDTLQLRFFSCVRRNRTMFVAKKRASKPVKITCMGVCVCMRLYEKHWEWVKTKKKRDMYINKFIMDHIYILQHKIIRLCIYRIESVQYTHTTHTNKQTDNTTVHTNKQTNKRQPFIRGVSAIQSARAHVIWKWAFNK